MGLRSNLWLVTIVFLLSSTARGQQPHTVRLVFVGDIMLANDEETGKLVAAGTDPFKPFSRLLSDADIAVGNLECVVAKSGEKVRKPYNFRADITCLPCLKRHFSALSVANNHSGDFGPLALAEQCEHLEKAEIPYFGGGRTKADAHKPWIAERNGIRIAMLGYCEVYLRSFEAEENRPGVAWTLNYPQLFHMGRFSRRGYSDGGERALLADVRMRRGPWPWKAVSNERSRVAVFPMTD